MKEKGAVSSLLCTSTPDYPKKTPSTSLPIPALIPTPPVPGGAPNNHSAPPHVAFEGVEEVEEVKPSLLVPHMDSNSFSSKVNLCSKVVWVWVGQCPSSLQMSHKLVFVLQRGAKRMKVGWIIFWFFSRVYWSLNIVVYSFTSCSCITLPLVCTNLGESWGLEDVFVLMAIFSIWKK